MAVTQRTANLEIKIKLDFLNKINTELLEVSCDVRFVPLKIKKLIFRQLECFIQLNKKI